MWSLGRAPIYSDKWYDFNTFPDDFPDETGGDHDRPFPDIILLETGHDNDHDNESTFHRRLRRLYLQPLLCGDLPSTRGT